MFFEDIVKIALYADDLILFLKDEHDLHHALNVIHALSHFSGLQMNKRKTEAMWLGSNKHRVDTVYDIKWKTKIKY